MRRGTSGWMSWWSITTSRRMSFRLQWLSSIHIGAIVCFRTRDFARRDWLSIWLSGCAPGCARRVGYGVKVVELLTTNANEVAVRIAQELEAHNRERRAIEAEV